MLLALDGFLWNWTPGSVSATASPSISITVGAGGSGGGHRHHHHGWEPRNYRMATDDYWEARAEMMKRHAPIAESIPEEQPEEVKVLAKKHDRLLETAISITNLPDLRGLLSELEKLSTQILDYQLQLDDEETLAVLLLC